MMCQVSLMAYNSVNRTDQGAKGQKAYDHLNRTYNMYLKAVEKWGVENQTRTHPRKRTTGQFP
jgi:hypothetical protein